MNKDANQRQLGQFARRLIVLPALVVALSLAFTGVASAQAPFQASVSFMGTVPFFKAGGCANGAFVCGTANIAGLGAASYNVYVISGTIVLTPCGSFYTQQDYFTLADDPSSTLVLDESGNECLPNVAGAASHAGQKAGPKSYGHPYTDVASWTVDAASTGVFLGLSGSGTNLVKAAGAQLTGSYIGTLG